MIVRSPPTRGPSCLYSEADSLSMNRCCEFAFNNPLSARTSEKWLCKLFHGFRRRLDFTSTMTLLQQPSPPPKEQTTRTLIWIFLIKYDKIKTNKNEARFYYAFPSRAQPVQRIFLDFIFVSCFLWWLTQFGSLSQLFHSGEAKIIISKWNFLN